MEAEGSTRRCDSEQLFSPEGLLAPNLLDVVGGGGVSPRGCTAPGPMGTRDVMCGVICLANLENPESKNTEFQNRTAR